MKFLNFDSNFIDMCVHMSNYNEAALVQAMATSHCVNRLGPVFNWRIWHKFYPCSNCQCRTACNIVLLLIVLWLYILAILEISETDPIKCMYAVYRAVCMCLCRSDCIPKCIFATLNWFFQKMKGKTVWIQNIMHVHVLGLNTKPSK